mmetsp:Transcript_83988/g.125895  ORF Transcript_83988/g.125895 Transcript_83988/m.125895 type:complete len:242 (-) Transcript_83988:40-765(-)
MRDGRSLLQLSFRTLHKFCIGRHSVIIATSRDTASQFTNLSRSFVDPNDITGTNSFLREAFDHFGSQVVNSLHIRSTQCEAPRLGLGRVRIDLNFYDFPLHDFLFFRNADPHTSPNGLRQSFRLGNFQTKDFGRTQTAKGNVRPELLGQAHRQGRFAGGRGAGNQNGPSADLALLDKLVYQGHGFAGLGLSNQAATGRRSSSSGKFQSIIDAQTGNMRVGTDAFQLGGVLDGGCDLNRRHY